MNILRRRLTLLERYAELTYADLDPMPSTVALVIALLVLAAFRGGADTTRRVNILRTTLTTMLADDISYASRC